MTDFAAVDFFADPGLVPDPYPYFDYLRGMVSPVAGGWAPPWSATSSSQRGKPVEQQSI